jgi:predicted PurR-regulated permease PerM
MLVIGVFSYIGLRIVGVQFALALAIISGVLEIVPILGPVISAVIAALVAVVDSPIKALFIVLVFTMIQQVEGNVLVPKVMQKVSGMNPIVILIGLLVGSNLFGIVGAIAAVPVMMIGTIVIKSVQESMRSKK